MSDQWPQSDGAEDDAPAADVRLLQEQLAGANAQLRESEAKRQAASDREALFRGELQHRVRNMLATIRSIFARTMEAGGTAEDIGDHFRGRLDAISRYQPRGSIDPGGSVDFETMIRDELQNFQFGDQPNIAIMGEDVRLGLDTAQLVGLALHELATNSIKFGALSPEGRGALHLEWRTGGGALHFEWRETGVSLVRPAPHRYGFGRQFIEQALPYQIDALTRFELRPGGVFCTIVVPLDPAIVRPGSAGDFEGPE